MRIYIGTWLNEYREVKKGFFLAPASNDEDVRLILELILNSSCKVVKIEPAELSDVNKDSRTLNFPNLCQLEMN